MKADALKTMTEAELREARLEAWPNTEAELVDIINTLANREHTYGTCVYAMSIAAEAAFRFIAGKLGVTGFQASCADLDFLKRIRHYKGPFMVVDGSNLLYPQYQLKERTLETLRQWEKEWCPGEAKKLLADKDVAVSEVRAHWQRLIDNAPNV